ncbi:response regulator transcription factor [Mycobacterium sp. AMU20-3851]|uniref:LuxR C-terminal-related transcriptional regulator n=1 Tax=Mycobacterium sp. AMU20-3851 TaxID=3122055 RepID=UPI0037550C23
MWAVDDTRSSEAASGRIDHRAMEHGRFDRPTRPTIPMRDNPIGEAAVQNSQRSPEPGPVAGRTVWSPSAGPSLLIVDDHTLHRENLAAVLTSNGAAPVSAWDLQSLFTALTNNPPDLVLLNLDTRDSGLLLHATLEIRPHVRVIVLGISEDDEARIVACAEAGVAGYHLRTESLDELISLISRVAQGESSSSPLVSAILLRRLSTLATKRQPSIPRLVLTRREVQILRMLDMGLTNREIAADLRIAIHTVKSHVHSVLKKLGVSSRAEAAARFRTTGLREVGPEN